MPYRATKGIQVTRGSRLVRTLAGISVALLCCVGVAAWLGLIPVSGGLSVERQPERAEQASDTFPCGRCGLIEAVREVGIGRVVSDRTLAGAALAQQLGGFGSVTNVLGLAFIALSGKMDVQSAPATLFETTVRFADGSLRVLTEVNPPARKPGDMVKVVRGRIIAMPEQTTPVVAAAIQ